MTRAIGDRMPSEEQAEVLRQIEECGHTYPIGKCATREEHASALAAMTWNGKMYAAPDGSVGFIPADTIGLDLLLRAP